jgi:hypothetical protein
MDFRVRGLASPRNDESGVPLGVHPPALPPSPPLTRRAAIPAYKRVRICYRLRAPPSFNRAQGRNAMAKGQMRSNKEKKKPKADKNLKKGGAAPVNPFAAGRTPAGQSPNSKKS